MLVIIVMIIIVFILFMFFIMMFNVYFDYILSIASSYSAHSDVHGVGGRHCVSVVLIRCLPIDTPYILGHVVDRGCDTPVESFVVHSPNIGQVGSSYEGRQAMFLIFLSNIPYV